MKEKEKELDGLEKKIAAFSGRGISDPQRDTLDYVLNELAAAYNGANFHKIKVTPHILRHTFCTRLENAGMNPESIQYLMGHGDLNVTMGTYAHLDYETAEKAFLKMFASG